MDKDNFTYLVGFDFSPSSIRALENAIKLSSGKNLKAIYTIELPKGIGLNIDVKTKTDITDKFNSFVKNISNNKIEIEILEGKFYESINNKHNQSNELMFMGLNDTGNGFNKYVGSNIQKLIAGKKNTLILQSKDAILNKKSNVLVQVNIDNPFNVESLISLLNTLNPAKVKLVHYVHQHNQFQLNKQILQLEELAEYIANKGHNVTFEILKNISEETNRSQLLNDYAKRHFCNLVVIGKRYLNNANGYNVSPLMIETIGKSDVPVVVLGE